MSGLGQYPTLDIFVPFLYWHALKHSIYLRLKIIDPLHLTTFMDGPLTQCLIKRSLLVLINLLFNFCSFSVFTGKILFRSNWRGANPVAPWIKNTRFVWVEWGPENRNPRFQCFSQTFQVGRLDSSNAISLHDQCYFLNSFARVKPNYLYMNFIKLC